MLGNLRCEKRRTTVSTYLETAGCAYMYLVEELKTETSVPENLLAKNIVDAKRLSSFNVCNCFL